MKTITEIIKPIELLSGTHSDTAQTGQGCFMNVIAYLNGEAQITDESECVCYVLRPLYIWANDFMNEAERRQLVPFIERAMGSRTDDRAEISRRLELVVAFANKMSEYAKYAKSAAEYAKYAKSAKSAAKCAAKYAKSAAEYAAKYAKSAAKYAEYAEYAKSAAKCAAKYAKSAAECAAECAADRQKILADVLYLFDAATPKAPEHGVEVVQRAKDFVAMTA